MSGPGAGPGDDRQPPVTDQRAAAALAGEACFVSVTTETGDDTMSIATEIQMLRDRIECLHAPDGDFVVVCRETGIRPEPATDGRFACYDDAEQACVAATCYRETMRDLDPGLTQHDLVVSTIETGSVELASIREATDQRRSNGLPHARQTVTLAGKGNDEWLRVENGPVVHFTGPDSLLDDEFVTRQLDSKLSEEA